ncbi:hypothetical protein IT774_13350 [Salinimonas marina]|uniref:Uncharacterized protein n=1 Tax=Salinimonas marina TaxID=2785918 RepID=A0A7S9DWC6_9ALTE|nr:hypothetical protein [Salinimonas marina]QPG05108.1 hypothetical protein IT774_13350 [Salinimonas marina]
MLDFQAWFLRLLGRPLYESGLPHGSKIWLDWLSAAVAAPACTGHAEESGEYSLTPKAHSLKLGIGLVFI